MSVNDNLAALEGKWKGTNKLYLSWLPDPIKESASKATVSKKVAGQFVEIAYTWEYDGTPHEGTIVIGCDAKSDAVQAVWTDSWHMSHKFMLCDGTAADGTINLKGFYAVPDHPDWGWRTEIVPAADSFRYVMYNVSPDGAEELAVDTEFVRA